MATNRRDFLKAASLGAVALSAGSGFSQLASGAAPVAKGIAVTIGLNEVDPDHYGGPMRLRGCVNDANDISEIAADQGFDCKDPLLDAKATRTAVIAAIEGAANSLEAGDIFLLHYSGHGGWVKDDGGDEDDGRDETWCLYDGMMLDDELGRLWAAFAAGVRVVVLSDSCHSGTVARGDVYRAAAVVGDLAPGDRGNLAAESSKASAFRFLPDEVVRGTYSRNEKFYNVIAKASGGDDPKIKASVLLISGCQDNQLSADLKDNGLFTARVKEVWNNGRFTRGYRAFHSSIVRRMPSTQSPNFYPIGKPDTAFWNQKPFTI